MGGEEDRAIEDKEGNYIGMEFHAGTPSPTDIDIINPVVKYKDKTIDRSGQIEQTKSLTRHQIRMHGIGGSEGCITFGQSCMFNGEIVPLVSIKQGKGLIEKLMSSHHDCGGSYLTIIESLDLNEPPMLKRLVIDPFSQKLPIVMSRGKRYL